MINIQAIDHIVLRSDNYDALIAFYCDVLGCSIVRDETSLQLTQLKAGTSLIDIIAVEGKLGMIGGKAPGASENNMDHFCLRIAPFDEEQLIKYLDNKGVEHGVFEQRVGAEGKGPSIYIRDIDGNTIELRAARQL